MTACHPEQATGRSTMIIRRPADIPSSEITSERDYVGRRAFIRHASLGAAALARGPSMLAACTRDVSESGGEVAGVSQQDETNSYEEITSYNNYYEFGTAKDDP